MAKDMSTSEIGLLRDLVVQTHDAAEESSSTDCADRWTRLNDLEPTRPTVWVNEEPWAELRVEFADELLVRTTDPFLRSVEWNLRVQLFRWRHYRADMVVQDVLPCPAAVQLGDIGVAVDEALVRKEGQEVGSHGYRRTIRSIEDVERIQTPDVHFDPDETERRFRLLSEIAAGAMDVEARGISNQWFALWDRLIQNLGVEEAMIDLIEHADLVHAAVARMRDGWLKRLRQLESMGLLATNHANERVGSGGYAYSKDLPAPGFTPDRVRPRDQWGCGNAQIFAGVSPAMHEEFSLQYERPWLEQFGLVYYGCCEQLHDRMHIPESIPRLRKVSASPWSDKARMRELCRGRYVVSLKPSPAPLAEDSFDIEHAEAALRSDLDALAGTNVEVILKDVSTLRGSGDRLFDWVAMAMRVVREYGI